MDSLRLPVFTSIQLFAFESAISTTVRQRAWVFSDAVPASLPQPERRSTASNASNGSQMDTTCVSMPKFSASSRASSSEWSVEYGPGSMTPCTCSGPNTSAHSVAMTLESMPPESPTTMSVKPAPSA